MLSTLEPSNAEKRRHPRHHCNILIHFDSCSQSGVGVLTDVSLSGASLTCRMPRKLYGFIRLSALNGSSARTAQFALGRVAWQQKDTYSGQTHAGIELELNQDWLRQALQSDSEDCDWEDPYQRLDLALGY
ncbi:MAG: PilZ domain-containing protein [Vulcanimicrobiota bacterium]